MYTLLPLLLYLGLLGTWGIRPVRAQDWPARFRAEKLPAALLIQVQPGAVPYLFSYGRPDLRFSYPLSSQTLLPLAGLSPLLSTLLLLQAVEAGRLELDEHINGYLQNLQVITSFAEPLTLHHLLSGRDGLPERLQGQWVEKARSVPKLEKLLNYHLKPLVLPPGSAATPGSWGPVLAAYLLENLNKQSLEKQIHTRLGLSSALVGLPPPARRLQGHLYQRGKLRLWPDLYSTTPAADQIYLNGTDIQALLAQILGLQPGLSQKSRRWLMGHEGNKLPYAFKRWPGTEPVYFLESHRLGISQLLLLHASQRRAVYLTLGLENRDLSWKLAQEALGWKPTVDKIQLAAFQGVSGYYGYRHYSRHSLAAVARLHRGLLRVQEQPGGTLEIKRLGVDPFAGFAPVSHWEPLGMGHYQRRGSADRLVLKQTRQGMRMQAGQGEFLRLSGYERPETHMLILVGLALLFALGLWRYSWLFWNCEAPLRKGEMSDEATSDPGLILALACACGVGFLLGFPVIFFQEPLPGELALAWQEPLNPWLFGLLVLPLLQLIFFLIAVLLAWNTFRRWSWLDQGLICVLLIATLADLFWLQSWHLIGFQL